MEDKNIVELFCAESELAIVEILKKYGKYIYVIALDITKKHEDAEECMNDSLMILWRRIPYCRPKHLKAYIKKVVYSVAMGKMDYNKAAKRNIFMEEPYEDYEEQLVSFYDLDIHIEKKSIRYALHNFYNSLTPEKQHIFIEKYIEEKSILQISQDNKITESKVKMMLLRMRRELKNYLKDENIYL